MKSELRISVVFVVLLFSGSSYPVKIQVTRLNIKQGKIFDLCLIRKPCLAYCGGTVVIRFFFLNKNNFIRTTSLDLRPEFQIISKTYGRISKLFSDYRRWIVCDHFKQKKIDLPPITRSQLAVNLRTVEPQVQIYWFLYEKRVQLIVNKLPGNVNCVP